MSVGQRIDGGRRQVLGGLMMTHVSCATLSFSGAHRPQLADWQLRVAPSQPLTSHLACKHDSDM